MNDLDLSALAPNVRSRNDTVLSNRLRNRFPWTLGRINWRPVPGAVSVWGPVAEAEGSTVPARAALVDTVVAFLDAQLSGLGMAEEWVAYVRDNTELEYEVNRRVLPEFLRLVADIPEHKYVFALDASWCCAWTMEDHLHFGRALHPGEHGRTR